ncbi:hypothetical protein DYB37_006920 [Aphanomyces astaci]|uniref:Condensation domain-containing protein n=1 Tax=Aphanomyces astaci TaxID=112090 RepID=A0A3R6XZX3_APHAT|nr:hypothetical protein DYB35_004511 [Aphanomyces astaci]RHZ17074.1 hypothetical protein DYB37_006920 [Aphanomyces astaci]
MFATGAMVNGSYTLSFNMTLHHAEHCPPLSIENVQAALSQLQTRHTFLRTKLVPYDSVATPFVLQVDHALRLPLIELPSNTPFAKLWAEGRGTPLRCGEPMLRVLWQPQSNTTNVVFLVHHAIADGRSLSCLAHDFLIALTTIDMKTLPPLPLVSSCDDVAKRAVRSYPLRSLQSFAHTVLSGIRARHAFAFPIEPAAKESFMMLRDNKPLGLTTQFDAATTSRFVAKCKTHHVSVTGALGAALIHAVADMATASSTKIALGTVADARTLGAMGHLVAPEHLTLFATALPMFSHTVQATSGATSSTESTEPPYWTTANAYGQHLQECTVRQDGLVVGLLMGLNMKSMMKAPKLTLGRPTIILSNSGVLPKLQTQYGDHIKVSHAHVTSNQLYSFPKVSASTMGGVLTLNFDGVAPIIRPTDLAMLQSRTTWHLKAMIA